MFDAFIKPHYHIELPSGRVCRYDARLDRFIFGFVEVRALVCVALAEQALLKVKTVVPYTAAKVLLYCLLCIRW